MSRVPARLRDLSASCPEVDAVVVASDENRRYLSGFSGSSGAVIVHDGIGELITDSRYWEQAESEAPDLILVRQTRPLWEHVAQLVRERGFHAIGFELQRTTVATWRYLTQATGEVQWVGLTDRIERLRIIKDDEETTLLKAAAAIAGKSLNETLKRIRPGIEEQEIAIELEWQMRKFGSDGVSFDTIVVSGPRTSLPHGRPTRRAVQPGELITIDFGATVQGYHSDETVTMSVGPASAEAKALYHVVCLAQSLAMESVRPGRRASEVDDRARSIIEAAGYGPHFGHGTGHGVGLEIHEAPWVSRRPPEDWLLQPGMVLTVEPGIYLPGQFGVRLEDTLIVNSDGYERVTKTDKAWREL